MKPIHGVIIRRDPPASLEFNENTARRLSESSSQNLARLHGLEYQSIGLGDLGKPEGYLERQVRGWTERYHGSRTHEFPEVERIVSWMQAHMPSTSSAALVHNDYKYDNLVLDPSDIAKIIGLLDWDAHHRRSAYRSWAQLSPIGLMQTILSRYRKFDGAPRHIRAA